MSAGHRVSRARSDAVDRDEGGPLGARRRRGVECRQRRTAGRSLRPSRPAAWRRWPDRCPAAAARRETRPCGSLGFSAQRSTHSTSLTCAASRNLSPPYLTNGMPRRVSSSSSGALWLELRNSTACDFSATPPSRHSSTRSATQRAWSGFVAHGDELRLRPTTRDRSRGSWCSARAARPMTAFDASRIGCVER